MLILLQKPGKPVGPLTSVRPIVLLSALRKTLSLIVLSRIATKVDNFLSPSQSGFRRGLSRADVVFGYRWLCAKAQRQRITIEFLCIDLKLCLHERLLAYLSPDTVTGDDDRHPNRCRGGCRLKWNMSQCLLRSDTVIYEAATHRPVDELLLTFYLANRH